MTKGADAARAQPRVSPAEQRRRTLLQPDAEREYEVSVDDLPLCCPMPQMLLWSSHPRVYLPIGQTGWAMCPYCSAEYRLKR